jgi:hypothetical protein
LHDGIFISFNSFQLFNDAAAASHSCRTRRKSHPRYRLGEGLISMQNRMFAASMGVPLLLPAVPASAQSDTLTGK